MLAQLPLGTVAPARPVHVTEAAKVLQALYPGSALMKKVVVKDLAAYPIAAVKNAGFSAWTNSTTEVYVDQSAAASPDVLRAVMFHESLHVLQFDKAGGVPPDTYAEMMKYECDAYRDTASFLRDRKKNRRTTVIKDLAGQMSKTSSMFCKKIKSVTSSIKDPARREDEYRAWMLGSNMLPKHNSLQDLYDRP